MNTPDISMRCALAALLLTMLLPIDGALGQWSVPDELQTQVSTLND